MATVQSLTTNPGPNPRLKFRVEPVSITAIPPREVLGRGPTKYAPLWARLEMLQKQDALAVHGLTVELRKKIHTALRNSRRFAGQKWKTRWNHNVLYIWRDVPLEEGR